MPQGIYCASNAAERRNGSAPAMSDQEYQMTERSTNDIPREHRVGAIAFPASDAGNDAEPGGAPSWPAELPELKRALAKSQRETHAARIVIRKLQEINARLKRELARLEQNQVTALALASSRLRRALIS